MSRSNYDDDGDNWRRIIWRGAVKKAINGARGQAFLKEMLRAMDALPERRLIAHELEEDGDVCAIGSVGKARDVDMTTIDPDESERVACIFGIADALVREISFENDEGWPRSKTPEDRFARMRAWVVSHLAKEKTTEQSA